MNLRTTAIILILFHVTHLSCSYPQGYDLGPEPDDKPAPKPGENIGRSYPDITQLKPQSPEPSLGSKPVVQPEPVTPSPVTDKGKDKVEQNYFQTQGQVQSGQLPASNCNVAGNQPRVVPEPAPQPESDHAPQPVSEPAPQPVYEPAPQPVYEPAPQPVSESAPEPVSEPAPKSMPEPVLTSSPERHQQAEVSEQLSSYR